MKKIFLFLLVVLLAVRISGQTYGNLTESTFEVHGKKEKIIDFPFNKGDTIWLDFEVIKGGSLLELECIQLPSFSRFMEYKIKKLQGKRIPVDEAGLYRFRFANKFGKKSVCKINIQRFVTPPVQPDTASILVIDQLVKISSLLAFNSNPIFNIVEFNLPERTIAWSYYLGVGKEGENVYNEVTENYISAIGKVSEYGPLAELAIRGKNYFRAIHGPDNVKFWFITNSKDVQLFKHAAQLFKQQQVLEPFDKFDQHYKHGDVINTASQMKTPLNGKIYLTLLNDNTMDPIDVTIKIIAIIKKE